MNKIFLYITIGLVECFVIETIGQTYGFYGLGIISMVYISICAIHDWIIYLRRDIRTIQNGFLSDDRPAQ